MILSESSIRKIMNLLIKQQLVEINTGHLSSISGRSRSSSSKSDDSNKASDEDTDYVEDKSPRTRGLKQKTKLVIKRIYALVLA